MRAINIMSSEVISVNQSKAIDYERLIDSEHALQLKIFPKSEEEGYSQTNVIERYLIVRLKSGRYLTQKELKKFSPSKIQQIEQLAQITYDANCESRHTSPEKQKEQAFINKYHINYVCSDGKKIDLKSQKLNDSYQKIYHDVHGGFDHKQGITRNQAAILECKSEQDVHKLDDQTFVEFYNETENAYNNHDEIFQHSLSQYTKEKVHKYLLSFNDTDEVYKTLSRSAHQRIDHGIAEEDASNEWLDSADFTNPDHVRATFQAIHEHGKIHLTTHHAFSALIDKVKEAWYQSRKDVIEYMTLYEKTANQTTRLPIPIISSIEEGEDEVDTGSPIHRSKSSCPATPTLKQILQKKFIQKKTQNEKELAIVRNHADNIKNVKDKEPTSKLHTTQEYQKWEAERNEVYAKVNKEYFQNKQNMETIEKELTAREKKLQAEIDYYRNPQKEIEKIQSNQISLPAFFDQWQTKQGKLALLTPQLIYAASAPVEANSGEETALIKLQTQQKFPSLFTQQELKAMENMPIVTATKSDDEIIEELVTFLDIASNGPEKRVDEYLLQVAKEKSKEASISLDQKEHEPHERALGLVQAKHSNKIENLDKSNEEDHKTLAALQQAYQHEKIKEGASNPIEKHAALIEVLKNQRAQAIICHHYEVVKGQTQAYKAWKSKQEAKHYQDAIDWLEKPNQNLSQPTAFAIQQTAETTTLTPTTSPSEVLYIAIQKLKIETIGMLSKTKRKYSYLVKDLCEAYQWLDGKRSPLTDGGKKALKKIHTEAPSDNTDSAEERIKHYQRQIILKLSGLTRVPLPHFDQNARKSEWSFEQQELTGFEPGKGSIPKKGTLEAQLDGLDSNEKAFYKALSEKIVKRESLSPLEKFALQPFVQSIARMKINDISDAAKGTIIHITLLKHAGELI